MCVFLLTTSLSGIHVTSTNAGSVVYYCRVPAPAHLIVFRYVIQQNYIRIACLHLYLSIFKGIYHWLKPSKKSIIFVSIEQKGATNRDEGGGVEGLRPKVDRQIKKKVF